MNKTYLVNIESTNPYFNLALEEFLLMNFQDNFVMIWQNESTVVIGKHQNTISETNYKYVIDNQIKIARRLSGGGAVYHDLGNINFSFIQNCESIHTINFKEMIQPIVNFLNEKWQLNAKLDKRNNIRIENRKISGNAEHIHKNRVLHHGTLLFNSNLNVLEKTLIPDNPRYSDKSIKSVKSEVTCILQHIKEKIGISEFKNLLVDYLKQNFKIFDIFTINNQTENHIKELALKKYSDWNWIYGYSPKYNFTKTLKINNYEINISFEVVKGIIETIDIKTELLNNEKISSIKEIICGSKHSWYEIENKIKIIQSINILSDIQTHELSDLFF